MTRTLCLLSALAIAACAPGHSRVEQPRQPFNLCSEPSFKSACTPATRPADPVQVDTNLRTPARTRVAVG
jgi:hypothetical protein